MTISSKLMFTSRILPSATTKCYLQWASIPFRNSISTSTLTMNKNLSQEQVHPRIQIKNRDKQQKSNDYMLPHEIYTEKELNEVKITHKPFESWHDRIAYAAVRTLRFVFDTFTGYIHADSKHSKRTMSEQQWLRRFIFLESIAGVPGMVAGMSRHMKSLRTMQRDHGWIHTLLSEAENERMHLLTFLELRQPGWIFRRCVLFSQGVFFNIFFITYLLSSRICHRFVGFLEEEAVITYTRCLEDLDAGRLPAWANLSAPEIAKSYWKLSDNAMMRDVLLAIRADEATHRQVNHKLADVGPNAPNPFLHHHSQEQKEIDTTNKK